MEWKLYPAALALAVLAFVANCTAQQAPNSTTHYTAAVVEFNPFPPNSPPASTALERMHRRLQRIDAHIRSVPQADIIVFPEGCITENIGLAQHIPPPAELVVPCANASYDESALQLVSCAAAATRTYVVVNMFSGQSCDHNRTDSCVYNMNVVFDRSGAVISTYRKYNVYYEPGISSTPTPDVDTFTTDFGVQFGHTICFDILFEQPAFRLIAAGVRNILHPSWWFGELPSLTSLQVQQGWTQAAGVNLLVAGIAWPTVGSTGTGIYSGAQGALGGAVITRYATDADQVLVRMVPKVPLTPEEVQAAVDEEEADEQEVEEEAIVAQLNTPVVTVQLLRENVTFFQWRPVNVSDELVAHELCNADGFCCGFEHRLEDRGEVAEKVAYEYIAAVYNGSRTFGGSDDNYTVLSCGIIACRDHSDLDTCARLFGPTDELTHRFRFAELSVSGLFRSNDSMVFPSTLAPAMQPLPTSMYRWTDGAAVQQPWDGQHYRNVTMRLRNPRAILLNFGVYGKDFRSSAAAARSGLVVGSGLAMIGLLARLF